MRLFGMVSWREMAAAVALVFLSACTVVVDEGGPGPRPRPIEDGPICTREYEPVCAQRGGDRRTFSNACQADIRGYRIIRDGECRRDRPDPDEDRPPRFCTREYRPVCAVRRGEPRTFPNACEARAADYRIVDNGPC